jgi:hypothetical protein
MKISDKKTARLKRQMLRMLDSANFLFVLGSFKPSSHNRVYRDHAVR